MSSRLDSCSSQPNRNVFDTKVMGLTPGRRIKMQVNELRKLLNVSDLNVCVCVCDPFFLLKQPEVASKTDDVIG